MIGILKMMLKSPQRPYEIMFLTLGQKVKNSQLCSLTTGWKTCRPNLEALKVQFLYWAGMAWIMMILDSNCENLRQGAILLLWNVMKNRRALGTTAKMWGFFYEYEVVTTTCVAAGVFTTMCGVHNGVNL